MFLAHEFPNFCFLFWVAGLSLVLHPRDSLLWRQVSCFPVRFCVAFVVPLSSRAVGPGIGSPPRVLPTFVRVFDGFSSLAFQAPVPCRSIGLHGCSPTPGAPSLVLIFLPLGFFLVERFFARDFLRRAHLLRSALLFGL
jgi:hypothetical protein